MKLLMRSLLIQGFALLLGVTMYVHSAACQTITASLGGIVTDSTGARLTGVAITLINQASRDARRTKTNGEGVFQFVAVPAGAYTLKVQRSGFEGYTEQGIELHPNDSRTLPPIALHVGSVNESVTVAAENEIATTTERSTLITAAEVKKLSTVGRDVSELMKTQPGFAILQTSLDNGASTDPSVVSTAGAGLMNYVGNGAPGNGTTIVSDGANVTDPGGESTQTQTVNMDMVAEVKVESSNFGADVAKGPTVITVVGKSGTSEFHGSVYTFARTYQMNAEDWFMKYNKVPQIQDRYIYPGLNVGGPVLIPGSHFNSNKKLVFSAGGEDYAQRNVYAYGSPLKSVINALVPTDQSMNANGETGMRQGNFSQAELANYLGTSVSSIQANCTASGSLNNYYHVCAEPYTSDGAIYTSGGQGGQFANGAKSFDPGANALLNALFPLPTGPTVQGYNWRALNLENQDVFQIRGRVDLAANDTNKLFAVYNTEHSEIAGIPEQIFYSPSAGSTTLMGGLDTPGKIRNPDTSNTASVNYTHIFGARATNEAFAALSYNGNYFYAGNANALLKSTWNYNYKGIYPNATKELPQLADYGNHGLPLAILPDFSGGRYVSKKFIPSGGDNFNLLLKSHTIKLGTYIERDTANQTDLSPQTNGQITNYYVPPGAFTDTLPDGTTVSHNTAQCTFNGCGANYLADFLLGDVDQFFQQNFNPQTDLYYWTISGFVQDSWKVTKRLTLDLGVRLDHISAWTDAHGIGLAAFSPSWYAADNPNRQTSPANLPGVRWHSMMPNLPMSGDKTRFAFYSPRFGLAYDVYGDGKTIVHGGWGMYRGHDSWNDFSYAAATAQGMLIASVGGSGVNLADVDKMSGTFQCNASTTSGCPSISAVDPTDDQQPLTTTYSFTLEQSGPWKSAFQIGYVGNQSQYLLTDSNSPTLPANLQNVNAIPMDAMFKPDPNPDMTSTSCNNGPCYGQMLNPDSTSASQQDDYRPFPYYTDVAVPRHILWANYNALQTSWNKQSGRLNYGVNYTWSKALGVRGGYNNGDTADPTSLRADYGPLAFDRTHVFAASYSFDEGSLVHLSRALNGILNSWMISGITQAQSGPNLQAIYSPDLALSGTVASGPTLNSGGSSSGNAPNIDNKTILGTPDIYLMPTLTCNPTSNLQHHQYIRNDCFALPSIGQNGPANLGYLRGPRFWGSDLTLQRRVPLAENRNLEFRVSAFDFLNHAIPSFSSRYPNEAELQMTGDSFSTTHVTHSPEANGCTLSDYGTDCFGYAGYKTGRRVMEVSARFNF